MSFAKQEVASGSAQTIAELWSDTVTSIEPIRSAMHKMGRRDKCWRAGLLACAFFLFGDAAADAHPHVYVTIKTELLYDASQELTGFRQHWTFDEIYSSFAIQGLDANNDGQYDRAELQSLADVNVQSLKEFDYFTFPKLGAEKLPLNPPQDYWLDYAGEKLTLNFTMKLAKPVPASALNSFTFSIYDPTIYVAFQFDRGSPVLFAGQAPKSCKAAVKQPEQITASLRLGETFFNSIDPNSDFGAQFAERVIIHCGS